MAGSEGMGLKRLYPSPVFHDVDGDGRDEIVIGDLPGKLTYCKRTGNSWSEEKPLKAANGKQLKFHNW